MVKHLFSTPLKSFEVVIYCLFSLIAELQVLVVAVVLVVLMMSAFSCHLVRRLPMIT